MRLFVAAYPPAPVADDLAGLVATLAVARAAAGGVNTRLVPAATWHITLAFLGEVPDGRRPEVEGALETATARWRAGHAEPPVVRVQGGGRFGRGRFTILWAGLAGEVEALRALASAVRRELRRARLPYDGKLFRPHLTLARPGDRVPVDAVQADMAALRGHVGPAWRVGELRLMQSHPGPKPRYDRLGEWSLDAHTAGDRPGRAKSAQPDLKHRPGNLT
ncbi:MAG TPA: RNA 2',3'-cyclic phosphodiesterase [Micromonosporaceae bacterium]|nr:RNA 2',3'-cyclic phosphodiesterase [Micromonosporaceae bacterium]